MKQKSLIPTMGSQQKVVVGFRAAACSSNVIKWLLLPLFLLFPLSSAPSSSFLFNELETFPASHVLFHSVGQHQGASFYFTSVSPSQVWENQDPFLCSSGSTPTVLLLSTPLNMHQKEEWRDFHAKMPGAQRQ